MGQFRASAVQVFALVPWMDAWNRFLGCSSPSRLYVSGPSEVAKSLHALVSARFSGIGVIDLKLTSRASQIPTSLGSTHLRFYLSGAKLCTALEGIRTLDKPREK